MYLRTYTRDRITYIIIIITLSLSLSEYDRFHRERAPLMKRMHGVCSRICDIDTRYRIDDILLVFLLLPLSDVLRGIYTGSGDNSTQHTAVDT